MGELPPQEFIDRLEQLNRIGIALSTEKHTPRLLETILLAAKALTHAEGGSLYRVTEEQTLRFDCVRNDSLDIAFGGTTGNTVPFPAIPLYNSLGQPNNNMVVAYAVLHDKTINIVDAYEEEGFDFSGTRAFDQMTGYRSKSFLTIPMKNHEGEIIGVLQLINALDRSTGKTVAFSGTDQKLAESLASQAAIALTNQHLILQLEALFEAFISVINTAIDEKSPHTGAHCQRVPVLTMMLAEAACRASEGPLAPFCMSEKQLYELKLAALLHDCGKITTPVHVVEKSTKLEAIFDRIHLVDARFEILKRDAKVAFLQASLDAVKAGKPDRLPALEQLYSNTVQSLEDNQVFIQQCNIGGEGMSVERQERVKRIAAHTWINSAGKTAPLLNDNEVYNLNIPKGTLTPEEREVINNHVVMSYKMLKALPWPKHLRNVPEFAGSHHERMDGKGYPRGLTGEQMQLAARMIGIADVFEALTSKDRPYKQSMTLTQALTILGRMKQDKHIDPDLFDLFLKEKIYLRYAEAFLGPEQMDDVDLSTIPGYGAGGGD